MIVKNYAKEHEGYEVPEGATYYGANTVQWSACFYKFNDGQVQAYLAGKIDEWTYSTILPSHAIELPEAEPDMPDIDWSKAPTWATKRVLIGEGYHIAAWADEDIYQYDEGAQFKFSDNGGPEHCVLIEMRPIAPIESHPDTAEEWDGKGLPPINMPIELKHKDATKEWANPDFHESVLAFVGREMFVCDDGNRETFGRISDYEFRPFKTKEQLERETFLNKATSAIDTTKFSVLELTIVSAVIGQLSKAGFTAPKGDKS